MTETRTTYTVKRSKRPPVRQEPTALSDAASLMYEALRTILEDCAYTAPEALASRIPRWHERARIAVARAEGRQP